MRLLPLDSPSSIYLCSELPVSLSKDWLVVRWNSELAQASLPKLLLFPFIATTFASVVPDLSSLRPLTVNLCKCKGRKNILTLEHLNTYSYTLYFILPIVRYCMQVDEITVIRLASVGAMFSYFYVVNQSILIQATPIFYISDSFSWQSVDLFLGLFSNIGEPLSLEIDNLVEFLRICGYFMVAEQFVYCHCLRIISG